MTFSLSVSGRPVAFRLLEDLLRIFPFAESNADYPEPLEALEQATDIMAGNQAARRPPGLSHDPMRHSGLPSTP